MRPPTACLACRNRRRKCVASRPGQSCLFCQKRGVHCTFTLHTSESSQTYQSPASSSNEASEVVLPPQSVCKTLINLYFRYVHDPAQWIFHQPSVMEDHASGTLPRSLLLGMIGLSARFCNNPSFESIDPRRRGRPYIQEAEKLLDVREMSATTIQLCMLLGTFYSTEGEDTSEAVYYSLACRIATIMNLTGRPVSTNLDQEITTRLAWTLTMTDVWSSLGSRISRLFPPVPAAYPSDETTFLAMRRNKPDPPGLVSPRESSTSLLTQMVLLNAIFADISDFITAAASQQMSDPDCTTTVDALAARLDAWHDNLLPQLRDTPENLESHARQGLGHVFVAVYLGYYHFGQLLYYQYLHDDCYGPGNLFGTHAARCKAYSTGLCALLYRAYDTPGAEVYYAMVGHVLVIASTVQLHTLAFGVIETEIGAARSRLERNFKILTELQFFWPTLDACLMRFQQFHRTCQQLKENTFMMDRWMVRFLFEFAKPVEEKLFDQFEELWPTLLQDLHLSQSSDTASQSEPITPL